MNIGSISRNTYYSYLLNNRISQNNQQSTISTSYPSVFNGYNTSMLQKSNAQNLNSAIGIKKDAEDLADATKKLRSSFENNASTGKMASSEDASKVTATAADGASNGVYSISISQIAQAQVNTGNNVSGQQLSNMQQGQNVISIKAGESTKDISFSISNGDTNEIALNKMAKAINDSKSGVKAEIVKDSANNVKLQLNAENTGAKNSFTIADKTGNAVASTGINNTTAQAKDAKFTVNNLTYTSDSNDTKIANGKVKLNLKQTTKDSVDITVKSDASKIEDKIETFVQDYNKLISDAQGSNLGGSMINGMLRTAAKDKTKLEAIGITVNGDNTLSIDKTKLKKSIDTNIKNVRDTISGYDSIATKAQNAANFTAKNSFAAMGFSSFDTYNRGMMMAYSYAGQGTMFNLFG